MKKDEKFWLVVRALDIIEGGIAKNLSHKAIKVRVEEAIGYDRKYFNTIFKTYVKCSMAEYIRTMSLLNHYRKWLTEKGVEKMLKNKELLQQFLYNYLTEQVEDNRDEFTEKEEYGNYGFMEDLEYNERNVQTSNFKVEEIEFEVDEEKQMITGKGLAFYDVSARTTDFYGDEPMSHFMLGEERTASVFYFDIHLDKTNLAKSHCKIEVC